MEDEGSHLHPKRSKPTIDSQFPSTSMQESDLTNPTLPPELVTEILSRLPVKTVLRFRCVSKSWLPLISSLDFVKTHLSLSVNNKEFAHHRLMWSFGPELNLKDCTLTSLFHEESVTDVFDLRNRMISDGLYKNLPDNEMILGSVDGLICLADENTDLFLWNPSIREYKKLPDPISPLLFSDSRIYGFGYDKFHDDYKVVATFCNKGSSGQAELKIYSLKSDSWKTVDDCQIGPRLNASGKFVNGKLHWPTATFDGVNILYKDWNIISFDLANEKWGKVEQPSYGEEDVALWLGVLGTDPAVVCDCDENHVDVWIMKEYEVKESWTKAFTIRYPDEEVGTGNLFSLPSFMSNKSEILVVFDSTSMIYNPKDESLRYSDVIDFYDEPEAEIYVESLVCPFSREGTEEQRDEKAQIKIIK